VDGDDGKEGEKGGSLNSTRGKKKDHLIYNYMMEHIFSLKTKEGSLIRKRGGITFVC